MIEGVYSELGIVNLKINVLKAYSVVFLKLTFVKRIALTVPNSNIVKAYSIGI